PPPARPRRPRRRPRRPAPDARPPRPPTGRHRRCAWRRRASSPPSSRRRAAPPPWAGAPFRRLPNCPPCAGGRARIRRLPGPVQDAPAQPRRLCRRRLPSRRRAWANGSWLRALLLERPVGVVEVRVRDPLLEVGPDALVLPTVVAAARDRPPVVDRAAARLAVEVHAVAVGALRKEVRVREVPAQLPFLDVLRRQRDGELAARGLA